MRKIFTIIWFSLTGICGNLWGAAEYSIGNFAEVSESTRNLLVGYIRCGSLQKPLFPTPKTPILMAIRTIAIYSRDIEKKVKQVKFFLDSYVGTLDEAFCDECCVANPTLRLPFEKACDILALLRKDLEVWLNEQGG